MARLIRTTLSWMLLMGITAVIFLLVIIRWHQTGDTEAHTLFIYRIMDGEPGVLNKIPNFLYHFMVIGVYVAFGALTIYQAIIVVMLLLYMFLAGVIFALVRATLKPRTMLRELVAIVITLALMLIAPVFFFTPGNAYFGYLAPYVYHNPTMMPLRPLSLLLFLLAVGLFTGQKSLKRGDEPDKLILESSTVQNPPRLEQRPDPASGWQGGRMARRPVRWIVIAALLTIAGILAKPHFVMILLPALAVMTLFQLLLRNYINWRVMVPGIIVPGGALLAFQAMTNTRGSIGWHPFYTMDLLAVQYEGANHHLLLKFIMSVLFPPAVYLAYFPQARRDIAFNLAWLCFLAGVALTYLFIDTGDTAAGNLVWSGQIGTFILFITAALFLLKQSGRDWRFWLCVCVLALHTISGIQWYGMNLFWNDDVMVLW